MSLDQDSLDSLKIDRSSRPAGNPGAWLAIVAAVLLAGGGTAWWFLRAAPIEVGVATAVAAPAAGSEQRSAVLDASGYVVARREATVSSKVTGKIADVMIEEGMEVAEGQIVARLDEQSLRPLLELAEIQLRARRTELDEVRVRAAEAERNLRRTEQLRTDDLVSEASLEAAQAEVDALAARLAALDSAVEVAEATVRVRLQDMDDLLVRAPFDGVIVSKDAQPGEMVSPVSAGGGFTRTGIATLVDMDSREIEVDVNEAYINRVHAGQRTEAMLDAYPDWGIPSHVINIVPTADRQKATVRVRIAFDELDPRILPNMGIRVSFLEDEAAAPPATGGAETRPAVRLPASAVVSDGGSRIVWRIDADTVERVAVLTGAERNGQIDILSGLSAGDRVVAEPVPGLAAGVQVVTVSR